MDAPKFTVSVLCFNHADLTKKCLESVMAHSKDYELIVTDNASTDETASYLNGLKSKPNLTVISNEKNLGFQEPNKYALSIARGEFFVLLNNDMEVGPGWLDALAEPFRDNAKMAVTGLSGTCCTIDEKFLGQPGDILEYIEGSCLMIPAALARKHGLFSAYLKFIYWEDTDLSLRMRELGYVIRTVEMRAIHHERSATTKSMDLGEVMRHNQKAMMDRWKFYIIRRNFRRRILVRRLGARGDVLLITPILRAIKNRWPQAEIQVITKHFEMLNGFEGLVQSNKAMTYFDSFYDLDLAYEKRPEVHIVKAFSDVAGLDLNPRWIPEMFPSKEDEAWGFRKSRGLKLALIHGGITTWPGKNWPVERMTEIVQRLKKLGFFTMAVGANDSPLCQCDDSITNCTPQQLYATAKHANLFVGLDSMPQHVMSAANVPSVVLFGPTNPNAIVRPSPLIIPVQASVKDAPCVGEHGRRKTPVTQAPCDGACIKAISVEMVFKAVTNLLRRIGL